VDEALKIGHDEGKDCSPGSTLEDEPLVAVLPEVVGHMLVAHLERGHGLGNDVDKTVVVVEK
jgi:hypothetical protein